LAPGLAPSASHFTARFGAVRAQAGIRQLAVNAGASNQITGFEDRPANLPANFSPCILKTSTSSYLSTANKA
jgi:hypothetical protein